MYKKFLEQWKLKKLAGQLRKPHGKTGTQIGIMMNKANEFLYDYTIYAMKLKETDHLLEIGFGNGLFFKKIIHTIPKIFITGIDFSEMMFKNAIAINFDLLQTGRLKLILGNRSQMDFPDNHFDKVFCINVAYFWNNPLKHLREIQRVLKQGGRFFAVVRTPDSMKCMPFTRYGFRSYSEDQWKQLVQQCGFKHYPALHIN